MLTERHNGSLGFGIITLFFHSSEYSGNGFKSFRIFGEKGRKENVQNEQAPSIKKNWFTSMFGSNKQETTIEQGILFVLSCFCNCK